MISINGVSDVFLAFWRPIHTHRMQLRNVEASQAEIHVANQVSPAITGVEVQGTNGRMPKRLYTVLQSWDIIFLGQEMKMLEGVQIPGRDFHEMPLPRKVTHRIFPDSTFN